jgi:hypothetical protein
LAAYGDIDRSLLRLAVHKIIYVLLAELLMCVQQVRGRTGDVWLNRSSDRFDHVHIG